MPSLQCFGQLFPVILRLNCGLLIPVKIIVSICFHKVVGRAAIQRLAEALFKTGGDDIYLRGAIPPPEDFFSFSVFHIRNYLIFNILSFNSFLPIISHSHIRKARALHILDGRPVVGNREHAVVAGNILRRNETDIHRFLAEKVGSDR